MSLAGTYDGSTELTEVYRHWGPAGVFIPSLTFTLFGTPVAEGPRPEAQPEGRQP